MSLYYLTDFEWRVIKPLLPNKSRSVARVDNRRVLKASFGFFGLEPLGVMSLNDMGHIRHTTIASGVG
jgi:hypothetical protein